jgi:maltodextrin utilization protein YvdJ
VQLQYWQTLKTKLSVTVSTVQNADTTDKSIVSKEQSQKPQIQSQQSTVEMLQEETMRSINVAEQGTTLSSDLTQHQQIQP